MKNINFFRKLLLFKFCLYVKANQSSPPSQFILKTSVSSTLSTFVTYQARPRHNQARPPLINPSIHALFLIQTKQIHTSHLHHMSPYFYIKPTPNHTFFQWRTEGGRGAIRPGRHSEEAAKMEKRKKKGEKEKKIWEKHVSTTIKWNILSAAPHARIT